MWVGPGRTLCVLLAHASPMMQTPDWILNESSFGILDTCSRAISTRRRKAEGYVDMLALEALDTLGVCHFASCFVTSFESDLLCL